MQSETTQRIEKLLAGVRAEALGWAHAETCIMLDKNIDPRYIECPEFLERGLHALEGGEREATAENNVA